MTRFKLQYVRDRIPERPPGYYEDVVGRGRMVGEEIEFDDAVYDALVAKYGTPIKPLTLAQKVRDFGRLAIEWAKAGLPVIEEADLKGRARACSRCPHWGVGQLVPTCGLCGCTELKHELATAKCPIGRWPASRLQTARKEG